ncbi:segregation and condensation protein A [Candidatus Macondimonas diazotrophica]|uniref:segregation and condensation protein A n=1 Tax=Candidatus Macondimonas diazotrophica TaxID=2305248 RepID=UPI003BEEC4DC
MSGAAGPPVTNPARLPADAIEARIRVRGAPLERLPRDLYIPPDALEVVLESFEGPLDLLLYLIRRQNLDILDIPVAEITRQYMAYIGLLQSLRLELAAEYLLMAAWLAEIKSRLLLPRPAAASDEEPEDPRAELVRRLQEYARIRSAADHLDALPRLERDLYPVAAAVPAGPVVRPAPPVVARDLALAFAALMARNALFTHHTIQGETLSIRARMSAILVRLGTASASLPLPALCAPEEGRLGVVVTFMAVLELVREGHVQIRQDDPGTALLLSMTGDPAPS